MNKKYYLEKEQGIFPGQSFRVYALRDIYNRHGQIIARKGDKGGLVSGEKNLSHEGNAWIDVESAAMEDSQVYGDALICQGAYLSGQVRIGDKSILMGRYHVSGSGEINKSVDIAPYLDGFSDPGAPPPATDRLSP